jgi:hypothetical protein
MRKAGDKFGNENADREATSKTRRDDILRESVVGFGLFPARLLLRKLRSEGSKYFVGTPNLPNRDNSKRDPKIVCQGAIDQGCCARPHHLFHLREKGIEILIPGAFALVQSCLYQAPEAKALTHAHHAGTMRTLVRLERG